MVEVLVVSMPRIRGAAREPDQDEPRGHPAEVGQLPAGLGGGAQQDQQGLENLEETREEIGEKIIIRL